jgi:hypothetical protein
MAFGKPPMSPALAAKIRANFARRQQRDALNPPEASSALDPYLEEEEGHWRSSFGDDARIAPHTVGMVIGDHLRSAFGEGADGEAVIEADIAEERLARGEEFEDPRFAAWAETVRAAAPKRDLADIPAFQTVALEMFEAFKFTSGLRTEANWPSTWYGARLLEAISGEMGRATRTGAQFEADPSSIVIDWIQKPRTLSPAYKPTGNPQAPLAFLRKQFYFDLDDEARAYGPFAVRPAWIRSMRHKGWIGADDVVTGELVAALLTRSEASERHALPAGYLRGSDLREELERRQDAAELASQLSKCADPTSVPPELRQQVLDSELSSPILEWLRLPPSERPPVPAGALSEDVAIGERSVDKLISDYERRQGVTFPKEKGQGRSIPTTEVDRIVAFANELAGRTRHRTPNGRAPSR